MGLALLAIGLLAACVGGIWLTINAFRKSIGWGLAVLFIPFAGLFYVAMNWREARAPFLTNMAGLVAVLCGVVMMPTQAIHAGMPAANAQPTFTAPESIDTSGTHVSDGNGTTYEPAYETNDASDTTFAEPPQGMDREVPESWPTGSEE